jgi:hypothetical protein
MGEWLLPPGTYQARVRGSASGAFTLTATNPAGNTNVRSGCDASVPRRVILVTATYSGQSLGTGDCTFDDGSFVDFYYIGTAGQCTITMTPTAGINAFIAIFDAVTGAFLDAIDDNAALGGVETRTYNACRNGNNPIIVGMNSFAAGQTGAYTMTFTIPNGGPPAFSLHNADSPAGPIVPAAGDVSAFLRQFRKR